MPAITVGFPEFEARLGAIRRRLNLISLQDSLCLGGAALILAISALFAASVIGDPGLASGTRLAASAIAIAAVATAAWQLRKRWLSLEDAAILVDRVGGLDARVSTMLAHPPREGSSELRSMLLMQVFELGSHWEVDRIAPLRLQRSAWALAAALAVLIATLLVLPDAPRQPPPEVASAAGAQGTTSAPAPQPGGDSGVAAVGRGSGNGGSKNQSGGDKADSASGDGQRSASPGNPQSQDGGDSPQLGHAKPATAGERDGERDHADPAAPSDDTDRPKLAGVDPAQLTPRAKPRSDKAAAQLEQKRPGDSAQPPPNAKPDPNRKSPEERGGAKAAGSGKPGLDRSDAGNKVLGKSAARLANKDGEPQSMLIKLRAFATSLPLEMAPQAKGPGSPAGSTEDPGSEQPETAAEQLPDTGVSRSHVTSSHQHLVRKLFTPPEQQP